ncbi:16S rRNA (guanine(1207)-N(2))-methyltransferase RsmC [Buchnera aphidicola]|uniref:16S rRNA (guanine(1207)-N(2))-methyltransferase RsmC n=1 Tax=Buchnera aphidicola TaxID=9 RepID=UPI003464317E
MSLCDESQVIIKNKKIFTNQNILFSGNVQDEIFLFFKNVKNKLHIRQIHNENILKSFPKKNICFRILPKKEFISNCTTLIFFWMRNKIESKFQLTYLISIMNINQKIFIVGRKKFGIKSIVKFLKNWIVCKKIDYRKKCILYYGINTTSKVFVFKKFIKQYSINNIKITTLPGVFDYKGIDKGSLLMISTFQKSNIIGNVLEIGSGSGILSIILKKIFPKTQITLIDNNSTAILCSKYNLKNNKINGAVLYSNIYSKIKKKFHLIISNPPTHYGIHNNNSIIYKIIKNAKKFLYKNGKIRIVVHSYISCKNLLKNIFGNYKIIKNDNHFNIYESIFIT